MIQQQINKRIPSSIATHLIDVNKAYLRDNLTFLRKIGSQVIDLIYIDPPFLQRRGLYRV